MIRIGVDFGGTKIEAAALAPDGAVVERLRDPNPRIYDAAVRVVRDLVDAIESRHGQGLRVGVGAPGSLSPRTGRVRNANSTWLNGRPFKQDLEQALDRTVRIENDANCFALSEAVDGAAQDAGVVFGLIIGTGCGAGLVVDGRIVGGRNAFAGEFGHMPLPWPDAGERDRPPCWCGRPGCMETFVCGPAFAADHARASGRSLSADAVVAAMRAGDPGARASFDRYVDRLGRGLAVACNLIDPDVLVLGGGMSNIGELYERLPDAIRPHLFSDSFDTPVRPARFGDSSGVRGAAWRWPLE